MYWEDLLTLDQCQNWFPKFWSGNFDVEYALRSKSLATAVKDTIKALIDVN